MEAAARAEAERVELRRALTECETRLAEATTSRDELRLEVDALAVANGELTNKSQDYETSRLRVAALEAAIEAGRAVYYHASHITCTH